MMIYVDMILVIAIVIYMIALAVLTIFGAFGNKGAQKLADDMMGTKPVLVILCVAFMIMIANIIVVKS